MTDIDNLEFTYKNGRITFVAVIDDKHGIAESLSLRYAPMQAQLELADKLEVPHFVAISYLHEETPCYYLLATNQRARETLQAFGCQSDREWFSVRRYSKLQHHLRGLTWSAFELDQRTGKRLGDLSDSTQTYDLPDIDF